MTYAAWYGILGMMVGSNTMSGDSPGVDLLEYVRPYLRQCGASLRPAWQISGRKLLDYLLVYIGSGQGRFLVGDEAFEVQEDDLCWIPPDTLHAMEGFAPSMWCCYLHFDLIYRPAYSHWDFVIPGGMLDLAEFGPLMHPPLPPGSLRNLCGRIRGTTNNMVGRLMHQVSEVAMLGQSYAGVHTAGLILEIVALILRGQDGLGITHAGIIPGIDHAAAYLREHCAEPINLSTPARIAGLSESHFRKLFSLQYGCPPREYLRKCRIQRAKHLMMTSQRSLAQIADACGFASVHGLSRAFRDCEGCAPSTYRRSPRHQMRPSAAP